MIKTLILHHKISYFTDWFQIQTKVSLCYKELIKLW